MDCILLAAGSSSRMGHPKQLITIDGKTIFRRSLELAMQCCEQVIAVEGAVSLGSEILPEDNAVLLKNPDYSAGQLGSLKVGLMALRTERFFVFLADLILVQPSTFYYLAQLEHQVVYPICGGHPGHPVLMDKAAAALLSAASPGKKAMDVLKPLNPFFAEVDDKGIYMDVDTRDDLERLGESVR
ncbi:MAG: hypothetical protein B0D92_00800 [Spirochaeta sp. LUC14_002_19_P3]|nr:MAG: hypothetical protein B0D92_00800 [Spirochaeta sp. LUC14_002_19_P3]